MYELEVAVSVVCIGPINGALLTLGVGVGEAAGGAAFDVCAALVAGCDAA